jgi:hypothetical protein
MLVEEGSLGPECTVFLPLSGKNHEGNKSPGIYDGINQRRFLCSRAMKNEAMNIRKLQHAVQLVSNWS